MSLVPVKLKRLTKVAKAPKFATPGSHCFDLRACFDWHDKIDCFSLHSGGRSISQIYPEKLDCRGIGLWLDPNHVYRLPTGLAFDTPTGYAIKIFIRSSSAYRRGITLVNSVGVIDSDYRDELFLLVRSESRHLIVNEERIAQGELVRSKIKPEFREIDEVNITWSKNHVLPDSRIGGIGSTGAE